MPAMHFPSKKSENRLESFENGTNGTLKMVQSLLSLSDLSAKSTGSTGSTGLPAMSPSRPMTFFAILAPVSSCSKFALRLLVTSGDLIQPRDRSTPRKQRFP